MRVAAVIVAAGKGLRAGGDVPKQYQPLGGRTVLAHALAPFLNHPRVAAVVPVVNAEHGDLFASALSGFALGNLAGPAFGGATRQVSVCAGLEAVQALGADIVLIHDAARPFVSAAVIDRAIDAAEAFGAAVPAIPVGDTIVRIDQEGRMRPAPPRAELRAAQTPQAFRLALIAECHRRARAEGRDDFTDDGSLAANYGHPVHLFLGEAANIKLTESSDLEAAATHRMSEQRLLTRVATGYDVHAFGPGDHVWLGGIRIPHERGLTGHSDADVVLHALTDALLGTMADGDIGVHFPPTDPQWKGAASDRFLAYAVGRLRDRGGVVHHLDVTIVCEAPAIAPWRESMRMRIAEICGILLDQVSVKATTSEKLGFTGRKEGISALATATVGLPPVG